MGESSQTQRDEYQTQERVVISKAVPFSGLRGLLKRRTRLETVNKVVEDKKDLANNASTVDAKGSVQFTSDKGSVDLDRMTVNAGDGIFGKTGKDFNLTGSELRAGKRIDLDVGGALNVTSTTQTQRSGDGHSLNLDHTIDRTAGLYIGQDYALQPTVQFPTLNIHAGTAHFTSGVIENKTGSSQITTDGLLNLDAIKTEHTHNTGEGNNYHDHTQREDIGTRIDSNGDLNIRAGAVVGKGVELTSRTGDLGLRSVGDIILEAGEKFEQDVTSSERKKRFRGRSTTKDTRIDQVNIANQLNANGNVSIVSETGDLHTEALKATAGNNIIVQAEQGNIDLDAVIDSHSNSSVSNKKGLIKQKNQNQGEINQTVNSTVFKAGGSVDINALKNIDLQAAAIQAQDSIYVGNTHVGYDANGKLKALDNLLMPENVTFSTAETNNQKWNEKQSGYRGIAKELMKITAIGLSGLKGIQLIGKTIPKTIKIGESSAERDEITRHEGNDLTANNTIAIGSKEQTHLTNTNLDARNIGRDKWWSRCKVCWRSKIL